MKTKSVLNKLLSTTKGYDLYYCNYATSIMWPFNGMSNFSWKNYHIKYFRKKLSNKVIYSSLENVRTNTMLWVSHSSHPSSQRFYFISNFEYSTKLYDPLLLGLNMMNCSYS